MPCDTIQTMTVETELKNINWRLLKKALEAMGFRVTEVREGHLVFSGVHKDTGIYHTGSYKDGKFKEEIESGMAPLEINAVKRAYSAQVIQTSAQSFGWKLTKTGPYTYEAEKR